MPTKPMRLMRPDRALTKRLRITMTVAGEVMAQYEPAVTEALRDPATRRELRQLVDDLASLLEVIQHEAIDAEKASGT